VSAVVNPATVGGLAELAFQPLDRQIEGLVEVSRAGLRPDYRPANPAGDLDPLAVLGLSGILLVEELDIGPNYPVVISLYSGQLLTNMLAIVIGNLDVTAPHDNIHATSWLLMAPRAARPGGPIPELARRLALPAAHFGRSGKR